MKHPTALWPDRWVRQLRRRLLHRRVARAQLTQVDGGQIERRQYRSYEDYLAHQRSKLEVKGLEYLAEYDGRFFDALFERLRDLDTVVPLRGRSVLCLAARLGTEVRAFQECHAFAVGVDLNPGPDNAWVLPGDFHALRFSDEVVDVVYTNSFDHVLLPDKLVAEVRRVLKCGGATILELITDEGGQKTFGSYEALKWNDPDQIVDLFRSDGFTEVSRTRFSQPWRGVQVVLRRS